MIEFKLFEQIEDNYSTFEFEINDFFSELNCKIISVNMTSDLVDEIPYKSVLVCYEECDD